MDLMAIATIRDTGGNTLGVRLVDTTDDREIYKDVPVSNLIDVLRSSPVKVQNLDLDCNKEVLVWTNGVEDRYPKIVDKQLLGNSPAVVLYQTDTGFIVSSFWGKRVEISEEALIKYAKQQGIANGKVTKRDGKEFISSIQGEYKTKYKVEHYLGEKVKNENKLKTILILSGLYSHERLSFKIVEYTGNEIRVRESSRTGVNSLPEFEGDMLELNNYMVSYKYAEYIELETETQIEKFVDENISLFGRELESIASNVSSYKRGGLLFGKANAVITNLLGQYGMSKQLPSKLSKETIISQFKLAKSLGVKLKIYRLYNTDRTKKIALIRQVGRLGINYEVLSLPEEYSRPILNSETVEYMFVHHEEYSNITVSGNTMKIRGLDGVYTYDMDKIHSMYKRGVLSDRTKSLKATVMGGKHNEEIAQNGELKNFSTTLRTIIIPDTVTRICKESIEINSRNKELIIGKNVFEIDEYAFNIKSDSGKSEFGIERVEFKSELYHQYMSRMVSLLRGRGTKELVLNSKLTVEQLVDLVYNNYRTTDANISFANEDDNIFLAALKQAINTKIELRKLDKPYGTLKRKNWARIDKSSSTRNHTSALELFIANTRGMVIPKLKDTSTKEKVTKLIDSIEEKHKYRVEEVEKKIREYK